MADQLQVAADNLDRRVRVPCANCGLRFGSCAHTRESEPLLDLIGDLVAVIIQSHQIVMGPTGPRCKSCASDCTTRRDILKIFPR